MENIQYKCAIFDLDGVLVDTAKYHYLAWKSLAQELRFVFTLQQNEALKGVSRMKSLELLPRRKRTDGGEKEPAVRGKNHVPEKGRAVSRSIGFLSALKGKRHKNRP